MPRNLITGNPRAQEFLRNEFYENRRQSPFVTDVRQSKAEARARAWQAMRERMQR